MRILHEYLNSFVLEENGKASLYFKKDGVLIGNYSEYYPSMDFNPDNVNFAITRMESELTSVISILGSQDSILISNPFIEWFSANQIYSLNPLKNTVDVADIKGQKDYTITGVDGKIHFCFSKNDFVFIILERDGNTYLRQIYNKQEAKNKISTDYFLEDAAPVSLKRNEMSVIITFENGNSLELSYLRNGINDFQFRIKNEK